MIGPNTIQLRPLNCADEPEADFQLSILASESAVDLAWVAGLRIKGVTNSLTLDLMRFYGTLLRKTCLNEEPPTLQFNLKDAHVCHIGWPKGRRGPQHFWTMVGPNHFATNAAYAVMQKREQAEMGQVACTHKAARAEQVVCTRKRVTVHGKLVANRYYFTAWLPDMATLSEHGLVIEGTSGHADMFMCWRGAPLFRLKPVGADVYKPVDAVAAVRGAGAHWQDLGAVYIQTSGGTVTAVRALHATFVEIFETYQVYEYDTPGMRAISVVPPTDDAPTHIHFPDKRVTHTDDTELLGALTGAQWPTGMVAAEPPALPAFACSQPSLLIVHQVNQ